ncbi:MAG: YDG domain-containing protein, partial [Oscillospiraceae bacterium]
GEYPFRIDYGIKKDGTSDITWQDNSTTFTSLTPNTKYMVYTKFIGAGFYNDVMSNGVEVTTEKSSISGTAAFDNAAPCYGDTITLTPKVDTQNCGELSYKWYRDNTEIAGETGTKYTVAKEDVGTVITVKVTAKSCTGELSCATPKIALRTITSLATANGKIYNGNTNATVHFTFKNVVNNDNVTATANATFNTKTAGDNKEVTLSSFALGQPWQDFYTCAVPKNPKADITPKTITGVTVGEISDVTYTGQWQTPSVTLTDGDLNETLEKDVDYTLDYANNKDVGTAKVTIKAKGNYNSNVEASFEIAKATPTIIVTAEKKETFMGRIFASHNDTLMVTAQVKGTQNGSAPSGTVAFSVKNGNGSYTPIAGGEKIGVAGGKAALEFKNPPVGALVFKAEFTSQVASNYTNGEGTSLSYSIDKGEQDALNIKGVPTTLTYGDKSFMLTANGGSGIGRVSYHVTSGSDVASVDETSGEVKILKSGTAIITATKAGDDSFNATMAQTELVVEQAQPRLAFSQEAQTVVYTGSPAQLQAPIVTLTGGDSYSETENGAILYQYKKGIMSSWEVGLPTQAGEYTICARLEPKGNYKLCTSQNITLTIEKAAAEPTVIPTGLQAITNTQKTLAAVTLPQDAKGIWSWKNDKTSLVADSNNKVQNFKAIFTPLDKDNYSATEKDIPLKVSKIVATFEKLDLVEITKENGSEEISADITIIGAEMPTEGAMVIEEVVTWSNSAPNIVKLVENNQGMSYKSTVTGLAKGISMVGIEVNGKPAGSVLVKYAPKAEEESNNGAGDIDSAADVVESILEGAEGLTEPEKAVVKSLGDELLKLPPEEKEKLAISTIENLDALVEKAQGIATQSTAEVEQNVENPIDTTKVQVKGMALASGSTAADSVEVKIKQQAPTKNQEGKQATLEFSMEMTVNGKPQQLKSPLLITLPLPKGVDTKDMVIRHTKQDGTAEDITYAATLSSGHYTIKGDSITMWANSFSTFTFMIAKNAVVPVAPVAPVPPTTSEGTTDHENEFWIGVVSKIQGAKKGDVIKINTGDYDKMPATVMEELRLKGIGMVITCGAKTVTIPAGRAKNAEKDREVWTINQLLELYKNYTFVDNSGKTSPSTGGYGYLDATTGETQPITGAVVETPELKDKTSHIGTAHTEKQSTATWIFVPIVGILLVAGGYATAIYRRKKPQEERGEDR